MLAMNKYERNRRKKYTAMQAWALPVLSKASFLRKKQNINVQNVTESR